MSNELALQVMGWMYAEACVLADEGTDIRKVEVPVIMSKLKRDMPEVFHDPAQPGREE